MPKHNWFSGTFSLQKYARLFSWAPCPRGQGVHVYLLSRPLAWMSNLVNFFTSVCLQSVFSLSSVSLQSVFSQSSVCLQSVFNQSSVCLQSVFSLSSISLQSAFSQSSVCLQSVFSLSSVCLQSVFSLSSISLQSVFSQSSSCLVFNLSTPYNPLANFGIVIRLILLCNWSFHTTFLRVLHSVFSL